MKAPRNNKELLDALWLCYDQARKNKRGTADEHKFELNEADNIYRLYLDIIGRSYKVRRSKAFITHNPVIREIFAAQFRDRIVHHLLFEMTGEWWIKRFIPDSYSCIKHRGTDYGIERMRKFMNQATDGGAKEAYIIQLDIRGYFMSLPREKLFEQILWGLNRQYPNRSYDKIEKWQYELYRYLWSEVIFDDPVEGVRMAGSKKQWEPLPKNKSLFHREPGVGIVIGNLTSQLLSNIYLDQLDRFMKYDMGFKWYGRYVDDFFVIVQKDELEYALLVIDAILPELLDCLGLELHTGKTKIQPVRNGAKFLGKFIHTDYIQLGKRTKDRFYRATIKRSMDLVGDETIISYLGLGKHYKAEKMTKKIFETVGWDYRP